LVGDVKGLTFVLLPSSTTTTTTTTTTTQSSLVAIIIHEGAHHLDLMFSHPGDPSSVIEARQLEMYYVDKWIEEHRASLT